MNSPLKTGIILFMRILLSSITCTVKMFVIPTKAAGRVEESYSSDH